MSSLLGLGDRLVVDEQARGLQLETRLGLMASDASPASTRCAGPFS